CQKYLNSPLTF
nr:immunoglobulin light chain junction region [Macaca mulatta]MOW11105.1 immunoglobulin light chain junction region [Macaca mulatta]MOW11336.1 immunoglobulin light chain junction region [Macaca mulatta]MOW11751.1 immunoglobulin light chain junction region [Macaca mulatta]MOW12024.1 immunoglobulin light chain junction region [Macaca mulatta]